MNLSVISFHSCPYEPFGTGFSGGMNVFLRELLERLSLMGIGVDVYTRAVGADSTTVKNDCLRVHHLGCGLPEMPTLADFANKNGDFSKAILDRLKGAETVIFSNYWLSARSSLTAASKGCNPLIHMNHTLEKVKERYSGTSYDSLMLRQSRLFWEFEVQKKARVILFPSKNDLVLSKEFYPVIGEKGIVVNPGVSEEFLDSPVNGKDIRKEAKIPGDGTLLLFTGREERVKNLGGLLEAIRELKGSDLYLLVVGGEPSALSGLERVRCVPHARREELTDYVDGSDCVVVPSFYESFGIFGIEALSRGKPVIAPRGTFLGEFIGSRGAGPTFDPLIRGSLSRAIRNFLEMRHQYSARAKECSPAARGFTWEMASSRFSEILSRLARG